MYYAKWSSLHPQITQLYKNWRSTINGAGLLHSERLQQFDEWLERDHGIITIRTGDIGQSKLGFKSQGDFLMFMLRWS